MLSLLICIIFWWCINYLSTIYFIESIISQKTNNCPGIQYSTHLLELIVSEKLAMMPNQMSSLSNISVLIIVLFRVTNLFMLIIRKSTYFLMSQQVVRDVSLKWHCSTLYGSYQNILPRTKITVLLTGLSFSTDTLVPAESSHIHCFNPINVHPLIGYNKIMDQNMSIPQKYKIALCRP